jgi:hypothetical protein
MIRKFFAALALLALALSAHAGAVVYTYAFQGQGDFSDESGSGYIVTTIPADSVSLAPVIQISGKLSDATDKLYGITPIVKGAASMNNPDVFNAFGHYDNLIGGPHMLSSFGVVIAAVRQPATAYLPAQMTYFRLYWEEGDQYGSGYRVEVFTPGYLAIPLHRAPVTLTLVRKYCLPLNVVCPVSGDPRSALQRGERRMVQKVHTIRARQLDSRPGESVRRDHHHDLRAVVQPGADGLLHGAVRAPAAVVLDLADGAKAAELGEDVAALIAGLPAMHRIPAGLRE